MYNFTEDEQNVLRRFFTNTDSPVFAMRNLPQETAGALLSRYSRTSLDVRRVFLDEFAEHVSGGTFDAHDVGVERARAFYDKVLIGYGDDSVARLGGAHAACEGISMIAAKALEDARVGIAFLEKSTRYVDFSQKGNGRYQYVIPEGLNNLDQPLYRFTADKLFDTYVQLNSVVIEYLRSHLPMESLTYRHPKTGEECTYWDAIADKGMASTWLLRAYNTAIRTRACDELRGLLPMATQTNVGMFGVGQAYEHLLEKLLMHECEEVRRMAEQLHGELQVVIPSFVKRGGRHPYYANEWVKKLTVPTLGEYKPAILHSALLIDWDANALPRVIAAILYELSDLPELHVRQLIRKMRNDDRERILATYVEHRTDRRKKPGRALEATRYRIEFLASLGCWRDLQRHQLCLQQKQAYTCEHGYDIPDVLMEAGCADQYAAALDGARQCYNVLREHSLERAQYIIPMAYRIRWVMELNLRELVHIVELRTSPQGHEEYRTLIQDAWKLVIERHPFFERCAQFVDCCSYSLGRLNSEVKNEVKKAEV